MTEAEAKRKWCPMFRLSPDGSNADADGGQRTKCIATACMMWRWHRVDVKTGLSGYCGLAGREDAAL